MIVINKNVQNAYLAFERTLFVWSNGSKIRCFSPGEIGSKEKELIAKGWCHTATIDPAQWIEAMVNGKTEPHDMIDELKLD